MRYRGPLENAAGSGEVRNELHSSEDHGVFGMADGIGLDLGEQKIGVLGCDVGFGRRQIESVQCQCAEP